MRPGSAPLRRSRLAPLVAAALVVPGVTGCGLVDDVVGGGSRMEEPFEYLPAGTARVRFVDREAIAERLGVDDVHADSSREDLHRYTKAFQDEADASTQLHAWLDSMVRDAAFSDLDVEWEANATIEDGGATVWKMRDDLDLDAVAEDFLDAGYKESGSAADVRMFEAGNVQDVGETGLIGDRYPVVLFRVAVIPDEHLIVSGGAVEEVVDAVEDDADSVADEDGFSDLVDLAEEPDDVELAVLAAGDAACASAPRGGGRAFEETVGGLGTPDGAALFTAGDLPVRGALLFGDSEAAEADAEAREPYLEEFVTTYDLDVEFDVTTEDDAVLVETDAENARTAIQSVERGEGVLACAPAE